MYYQLQYYYRNRETILQRYRENAKKNAQLNKKCGVSLKIKGGGRPLTKNPLNLDDLYQKQMIKKYSLKVKKGNYNLDFS